MAGKGKVKKKKVVYWDDRKVTNKVSCVAGRKLNAISNGAPLCARNSGKQQE